MADVVRCEIEQGIATVTLNRPERRNAMSAALLAGLREAFAGIEREPGVRAVVVRGAGPAFCAGMDLRELAERRQDEADPEREVVEVLQQIERCPHPTVAMVNGDAFAGGCQLAIHCDLRVAAEGARFAMPLGRLGLVVPFPLGQKLVEVVGAANAREILLLGEPVDAARALAMGLVHRVAPASELEGVAYGMARTLAGHAPLSMAGLKAVIQRAVSLRERLSHEDIDALAARARKSDDAREGIAAVLEKRRPVFRGH